MTWKQIFFIFRMNNILDKQLEFPTIFFLHFPGWVSSRREGTSWHLKSRDMPRFQLWACLQRRSILAAHRCFRLGNGVGGGCYWDLTLCSWNVPLAMSRISSVSEPGKESQCSQRGRLNVEYFGSTVRWPWEAPGHGLPWVWKGLSKGCRMGKMGKSHSLKIICIKEDRSIWLWDS